MEQIQAGDIMIVKTVMKRTLASGIFLTSSKVPSNCMTKMEANKRISPCVSLHFSPLSDDNALTAQYAIGG